MPACEGGGACCQLPAENSCWIEPGLRLLCCFTGFGADAGHTIGVHLQREQEAVGLFWLLIIVINLGSILCYVKHL